MKKNLNISMLVALIALLLVPPLAADRHFDEREERRYQRALRELNDRNYEEAASMFEALIDANGHRVPGSLYWRAWALNKMNEKSEALMLLARIERDFPQSSWVDDAEALEVEIRNASGQGVEPESVEDEEVRIMAIHSLAMSDPDRAIPILEKILRGPHSMKMKEKALFVLTQSRSAEASRILERTAMGEMNPDLQKQAIEYIGIMGSRNSGELLNRIYASSESRAVRLKILEAYMISRSKADLLRAARTEKDAELRGKAVSLLGIAGGTKELGELYRTESDLDVRKKIIEGLFVGNATDQITAIARAEKNRELRKKAIESLGVMGKKTGPTLVSLYKSESDHGIKKKIVEALFVQSNARALIDLAEAENDRELRKELIQKLSIMNSDEAREYMVRLLGVS